MVTRERSTWPGVGGVVGAVRAAAGPISGPRSAAVVLSGDLGCANRHVVAGLPVAGAEAVDAEAARGTVQRGRTKRAVNHYVADVPRRRGGVGGQGIEPQ